MTTNRASTPTRLRILADLIDAHPELPQPFISAFSSGSIDAQWYLHHLGRTLTDQKAIASQVMSTLGGQWDQWDATNDGDLARFSQVRGGMVLIVTVARAALTDTTQVAS